MKKEIPPTVIIGAAIGLIAVIVFAIFFVVKSDPASQAPNAPPRFDASAKEAESRMATPRDRMLPGTAPK